MTTTSITQITSTLNLLHQDSRNDLFKMMKGAAKSVFGFFEPKNFEEAYLAISKEQGEELFQLIKDKDLKNIVEFGTSFGISTLYLAQGALATGGNIITTELLKSKAEKAIQNFTNAGVSDLIEVRIGDAMETLSNHSKPIDLLLLDGWKDLYLPLFRMLEPNFHAGTIVYVDNADMKDTRDFIDLIRMESSYTISSIAGGKAALIGLNG